MDALVTVVLQLGLAFIMFSLGIGLTPADFLRVGQRPVAFLVGALNQVVLLPIIALLCIVVFGLRAEIAVGVMILALCPGGVTSNLVAKYARGDVALSVSLTAVISLTSMITVPLILAFSMQRFMGEGAPQIDVTRTALKMCALTVVPVCLGLLARHLASGAMIRAERGIGLAATLLFVIIVAGALAANWDVFLTNLILLGPALVCLLVVLSVIGFFVPRLLGRSLNEAKTISIETGIQNGTLGITVATLIVGGGSITSPYAIPSAVYSVLMYLMLIPAVTIFRRMD